MGILATQATTPIIGQIAWLLGKLMNGIFVVLDNFLGIQNIGLCIIIFTIIIYTLMLPLTIKQQRFSKMSAVMNPEIQKLQNKYKGKKDQDSMLKQQEEMKLIYEKYGTSPTGGCAGMFIQFPILLGLYQVIRNIPAYVDGIKDAYMPLVNGIMSTDGFQKVMEKIGEAKPILMSPKSFDYAQPNTLIDVLYKFQPTSWDTLADKFPHLGTTITDTESSLRHLNSFLGINIADTPSNLFMTAIGTGAVLSIILAVAIPLLSGLTQYLSIKLMPQSTMDQDNPMASSMKAMNMFMPIFSIFMCFTLPAGLGLYWIASAVVRCIQQALINSHLNKQSMEDLIEKNVLKAKKKREKKGVNAQNLNEMAKRNVRNIDNAKKLTDKEKEAKIQEAAAKNVNAKEGSLASKANLVKKFNENNQ